MDYYHSVPRKIRYHIGFEILTLVPASLLQRIAEAALLRSGVQQDRAELQVAVWLDAELRGITSHGLLRLERIVARIERGLVDPATEGAQEWLGDSFLAVDGQRGLGPVVADKAIKVICDRARQTGIALAAVSNSQHIGMLAWYAEAIARGGQAAIVLSTSEALVHPWGGRLAMVGTNPIAIGMPSGEAEPS
jgi:L-2-hydroxycarboxylate dehydrogenase (NAD+)